jgi:biotin carboxyl carrier protein
VKYLVQLGDRVLEVVVNGIAVETDGRPAEAHLARVDGTPLRHLLLDGRSYEIVAVRTEGAGRWRIVVGDQRFDVAVTDHRAEAIRGMLGRAGPPAVSGVVTAPMPGLVVRVPVEEGQRVEAGTGLVVVEAMKMENELRATAPGVVRRIHVAPGDAVDKGQRLVELDAAE